MIRTCAPVRADARRPSTAAGRHAPAPSGPSPAAAVRVFRCACGGACPRCRDDGPAALFGRGLEVSRPGDRDEVDAERLAAAVLSSPRVPLPGRARPEPAGVRRLASTPGGAGPADGIARPAAGGRPLSSATRELLEPRFGIDLSGVRVHAGAEPERLASRLRAKAFTLGSDIWLGAGASEGDRRLMAHELAHVVQQREAPGRAPSRIRRTTITDGFLTFETAPAFLTEDYTVGDTAVEILRASDRYRSLLRDLQTAFGRVYGAAVPTRLTQFQGGSGNAILCGDDAAGCCRNCDENCGSLGISAPAQFFLFAELFGTGWSSGLRVPSGFRVAIADSPEVATASIMFHELLHLWFYQYLCVHRGENRAEPSGHNGGYDPDFARMWREAHRQIEAAFRARRPATPAPERPAPSAPRPLSTLELGDIQDARSRRAGVPGGFRLEAGAGGELQLGTGRALLPIVWGDLGYQFGADESSRLRWRLTLGGYGVPGEPIGAVRAQVGLRILQEQGLRGGRPGSGPAEDPFYFDFNAGVLYRLDERPGEGRSPGVSGGVGLGKIWRVGSVELEVGASANALYLWQLSNPGAIVFGGHGALRF